MADADRQADAEGRDLVGRLYPRAAGADAELRAQVAGQRRRRVPAARRGSRSAATTCTARRVGFNVVVSGNPYKPLTPQNLGTGPVPVNPRPADANTSTRLGERPGAREAKLTDAIGKALDAGRHHAAGDELHRRLGRRPHHQPPDQPDAEGDRPHRARCWRRRCPIRSSTSSITPVENGLPTTTVTVDRSDLEAQVDRPNAGEESWETTRVRAARCRCWPRARSGSATSIRWSSWAMIPVPTVQIFGGNDGLQAAADRAVPRQREGDAGPVVHDPDPPADPRRVQRSRPDDPPASLPPVRSDSARYYAGWDPKLIRLTGDYLFKLNRDTYAPRVGRHPRARRSPASSGEVLWKPVEQNWGLGARAQLGGAARLRQPVRLRLLRLRRGDRPRDALLGHRLERDRDRSSPPAAISPATGAARSRCSARFANGWAVGAYATKTDVTADEFGEGSFAKGVTLIDPAALVDAVRDPADHQRRPDLAREQRRRVPEHPEPALPDRARPRPQPSGAELGSVLGMMRVLACLSLAGAGRLRQRRQGSDRPGGDRARSAASGRRQGGQAGRAAARGHPRRHRAGRRGGDPGAARVRPVADADVRRRVERRLRHLRLGAAARRSPCAARRRSPGRAASAPTCCRPGAARPTRWRGRSRRRAGRRGCGGSTSCPARDRRARS